MAIFSRNIPFTEPYEHIVHIPQGRWTEKPINRRMLSHTSPFDGPFCEWLADDHRRGSWRMHTRMDVLVFEFTDPNTAMEFKMRFG
jgi:hypothetical protein